MCLRVNRLHRMLCGGKAHRPLFSHINVHAIPSVTSQSYLPPCIFPLFLSCMHSRSERTKTTLGGMNERPFCRCLIGLGITNRYLPGVSKILIRNVIFDLTNSPQFYAITHPTEHSAKLCESNYKNLILQVSDLS